MFCRNCGKEISENAVFCSYCGTKLTENKEENGNDISNSSKSDINEELIQLLLRKMMAIPKYPTVRNSCRTIKEWWNGVSIFIGSNSILVCNEKLFDIQDIQNTFLFLHQNQKFVKCYYEDMPECFKQAIKAALNDYKNKTVGDFYFVAISEQEKYCRNVKCIVQIENSSSGYKYIVGVEFAFNP